MIPFLICYRTGIYHIVVLNVNILLEFVSENNRIFILRKLEMLL